MSHRETIQKLIDNKTVASVLRRRSNAKEAVQALQNLLYELGFEEELNWQKYGADGDYGGGTTRAVADRPVSYPSINALMLYFIT